MGSNLREALLGAFTHHAPGHPVIGALVRFAQMTAFALSFSVWRPTIEPLLYLTEFTTVAGYVAAGPLAAPGPFLVLFDLALVWVAVFVALFAYAAYGFYRNSFPVLWPLRLLRSMGALSASVAFIPLTYLLFSIFACGLDEPADAWDDAGYTCYAGAHLALAAIAGVLLAAFIPLAALFACLVFDAHPLSSSLAAKAHGRADLMFIVAKTALVVVVEVFPRSFGPWAAAAVVAAGAVSWVAAYTTMMPFTRHAANRLQLACACANAWTAACLLVALAYPGFDAAVALYLGLPLAAAAGVFVANLRAESVSAAPVSALATSYDAALKARYALHEAIWGHPTSCVVPQAAPAAANDDAEALVSGLSASDRAAALEALASGSMDDAKRVTTVRDLLAPSALDTIAAVYASGLSRFSTSPLLHVSAAQFHAILRHNRHLEMQHLQAAERLEPFLDVALAIRKARQLANGGEGKSLNAIARVAFDKNLVLARKCVVSALMAQARFWASLAEPVPDVARLIQASVAMNRAIASAEAAFDSLLRIRASSVVTLRLCADFHRLVLRNEARATTLVAEADRIEDALARSEHSAKGSNLHVFAEVEIDVMSDSAAVIVIGADAGNLGIIQSVNSAASKMFGYVRNEMVHRNLSMLMPSAIGSLHDGFLKRYMKSGDGRIVDYTRVVIGLHRSGTIFPMLASVRESSATEDAVAGTTTFVGIMRPFPMSTELLLLDADFVVSAASAATLTLLGIDASSLLPRHVGVAAGAGVPPYHISEWVKEWTAELPNLRAGGEVTLLVDAAAREDALHAVESARGNAQASTWVVAQLQSVPLGRGTEGHVVHVLYWSPLNNDPTTIARARARRRSSLLSGEVADGNTISPPARVATHRGTPPKLRDDSGGGTVRGCPFMAPIGVRGSSSGHGDAPPRQLHGPSTPRIVATTTRGHSAESVAGDDGAGAGHRVGGSESDADSLSPGDVTADDVVAGAGTAPRRRITFSTGLHPLPSNVPDGSNGGVSSVGVPVVDGAGSAVAQGKSHPDAAVGPPHALRIPSPTSGAAGAFSGGAESADADGSVEDHDDEAGERAKQRSVGGGSSSKNSSTKKSRDRLRRVVLDTQQAILPGLVTLRRVAVLTVLGCVALAIGTTVVEYSTLSAFRLRVSTGLTAPRITLNFITAAFYVRQLVLTASGWVPSSPEATARDRAYLLTAAQTYSALCRESRDAAATLGDAWRFMSPTVMLNVPSGVNAVSLMEAASTLEAATDSVATMPLINITTAAPLVQTVLMNVVPGNDVHDVVNASTLAFFAEATDNADTVISTSTIVVIAASLSIVTAALLFIPFLAAINRQRDCYIRPFLTLPSTVVEKLRVGAERRAARARRAGVDDDAEELSDDDDDTVLDIDGDDEDDDVATGDADWRTLLQASMTKTRGAAYVGAPPADGSATNQRRRRSQDGRSSKAETARSPKAVMSPHMLGALGRSSRRDSRASSVGSSRSVIGPRIRFPLRPHRNTGCSLAMLSLRFAVPLLALLVFFGVKFAVTAQQVDAAMLSASVAVVASYRATAVREVVNFVRRSLVTPGAPGDALVASRVAIALDLIDTANYDNTFLMFGEPLFDPLVARANDALGTPGAVPPDVRAAMVDAYYVDGCAYVASVDESVRTFAQPFNASACAAFGAGVVARGLYGAHASLMSTARSLVALRAGATIDATGAGTDAAGRPLSLPSVLSSAAVADFYTLAFDYLEVGYADMALKYEAAALLAIDDLRNFNIGWTTAFLAVFIAAFALVYLPQTAIVSHDIKEQRIMLVLLPPAIAEGVDDLAKVIASEIARETTTGASGWT